MYDKASGRHNVRRMRVRVPSTDKHVLPDLARDLPKVEFPSRLPGMAETRRDPGYSLAEGSEYLPVSNPRTLRVDLVLDFSELDGLRFPSWASVTDPGAVAEWFYEGNVRRMLAVGRVLSHIRLASGCVRVSAVNLSRLRLVVDRQDSEKVNWGELERSLVTFDHDRIDAVLLEQQQGRSAFIGNYLTELAKEAAGCGSTSEPGDRVVMLVSTHVQYPRHTPVTPLRPETCPGCRFVNLSPHSRRDPYLQMLKPLSPRLYRFSSPREFRKTLKRLIAELER
jgi:hypothetical protein